MRLSILSELKVFPLKLALSLSVYQLPYLSGENENKNVCIYHPPPNLSLTLKYQD